ncbi:DNA-processing protein DprA [bacterium]|nr:DNA-processing protein DprA [bacterium]
MKVFQSIAIYLITKQVVSNHSMARWFIPMVDKFKHHDGDILRSGDFHEYVRKIYAQKLLSNEVANYLLQITLWIEDGYRLLDELLQQDFTVLLPVNANYPTEFLEISDRPSILFCSGDLSLLNNKEKITLVGTREPSLWGKSKAGQFALEAAFCGITTVSGLAQGIDAIIFEKTVEYRGQTIAVLPQLNFLNTSVPDKVLYLSEYPPSVKPVSKWQFIARNRLLAALSPITIIVEAPVRSGTLITAELALGYGRSVYVALPDPNEESGYGGQVFGITQTSGCFVQSLYDVFYLEGKLDNLEKYKKFIEVLSQQKISIKSKDCRHLAQADLKRYLYSISHGDLSQLDSIMIELHRFGIIKERKNKVIFNFSGYNSWPKI